MLLDQITCLVRDTRLNDEMASRVTRRGCLELPSLHHRECFSSLFRRRTMSNSNTMNGFHDLTGRKSVPDRTQNSTVASPVSCKFLAIGH